MKLKITLIICFLTTTVFLAQKTVNASDILNDIKAGKSITYKNAKIVGILDFTYMDEAMQYWEDAADIIEDLGADFQEVMPNSMIGVPFADWECNYCNFKDKCHGIV